MAERQQVVRQRGRSSLSLDPRIDRIGVAHFDGAILADWTTKTVRRDTPPEVRVRKRLIPECVRLLDRYEPTVLVLPDIRPDGDRRSTNVRAVVEAVAREASERAIVVVPVSDKRMKAVFDAVQGGGGRNKQRIADIVATWFPEVASRRPRARKLWQSDAHSTPLYDAIARWCAWRGLPRRGSAGGDGAAAGWFA